MVENLTHKRVTRLKGRNKATGGFTGLEKGDWSVFGKKNAVKECLKREGGRGLTGKSACGEGKLQLAAANGRGGYKSGWRRTAGFSTKEGGNLLFGLQAMRCQNKYGTYLPFGLVRDNDVSK